MLVNVTCSVGKKFINKNTNFQMTYSHVLFIKELFIKTLTEAHTRTCLYTAEQVAEIMKKPYDYAAYLCYKNMERKQLWLHCAQQLTKMTHQIIEFAKMIPGFLELSIRKQILLLKAGCFEVSVLRMSQYLDPVTGYILYNGTMIPTESFNSEDTSELELINNAFEMARNISKLKLTVSELALFSAAVILSPDRPGLKNVLDVQTLYETTLKALKFELDQTHKVPYKEGEQAFDILMAKLTDLRVLSTLHRESLGKFKVQHPILEFPTLHKEVFSIENV